MRWKIVPLLWLAGCSSGSRGPDQVKAAATRSGEADSPAAVGLIAKHAARFQLGAGIPMGRANMSSDRSLLVPPLVQSIERLASGDLKPHLVQRGSRQPAQLTLPATADGLFHVTDGESSVAAHVRLAGLRSVPAQIANGFVVYPAAHPDGADVIHRPSEAGTEDFIVFERAPSRAQIRYEMALSEGVAGLRLAANRLELIDKQGLPRLRVGAPYLQGIDGKRVDARLDVEGCKVDRSPGLPWRHDRVSPGARTCTVVVDWSGATVAYPALLDPSWTLTNNLIAGGRGLQTAVLLNNGDVMIAGGATQSGLTAEVDIYHNGVVAAAADSMKNTRIQHTMTKLANGQVFIVGGMITGNTHSTNTTELWNADGNTRVGSGIDTNMNHARAGHTANVLSTGQVLVVGGVEYTNDDFNLPVVLNTSEIWSPGSGGVWSLDNTTLPTPIMNQVTATGPGDSVALFGGRTCSQCDDQWTGNFLNWTPGVVIGNNDQWLTIGASTAHSHPSLIVLQDGKYLVFGDSTDPQNPGPSSELFEPVSPPQLDGQQPMFNPGVLGTGTLDFTAASLLAGPAYNGIGTSGPEAVAAGGHELDIGTTFTQYFAEKATAPYGVWTAGPALNIARYQASGTLLKNGEVLVIGGLTGIGVPDPTAETYHPGYLPGVACGGDPNDCANGFCVAGVCCSSACAPDVCHAAACPTGTCDEISLAKAGPGCGGDNFCQLQAGGNFGTCNGNGSWKDTDGDGISDAAETADAFGNFYIDNNCNGVYDAGIDINLNVDGAPDPNKPDVYLHYDFTNCAGGGCGAAHTHDPISVGAGQAVAWMKQAFTAHSVNLHIDPAHTAIDENAGGRVTTLAVATDPNCTGPNSTSLHVLRAGSPYLTLIRPIYHYMVVGHYATCDPAVNGGTGMPYCSGCPNDPENPTCGAIAPQKPQPGNLGTAEVFGDDSIVATQNFTDTATPLTQEAVAGLMLHEFGHNLGLQHGGSDCFNSKPNYVSVMNYNFYTKGIPVAAAPGVCPANMVCPTPTQGKVCAVDGDCPVSPPGTPPTHCSASGTCLRLDYSRVSMISLDESGATTGIDEDNGVGGPATDNDLTFYKSGSFFLAQTNPPPAGSWVDFKHDGLEQTALIFDVNGDGQKTQLSAQIDWGNMKFAYQCQPTYADAGVLIAGGEPTIGQLIADHQLLPPLGVQIDIRPGCGSNWIAPSSSSTVPVVIFGSATVDATKIDPTSLFLNQAPAVSSALSDVNGDGRTDLTANFMMSATGLALGATSATLAGALTSSQAIYGTDSVTVVPAPGPVVVIHNDGTGYAQTISHQLDHKMTSYTLADCADSATDHCGGVLNVTTAGNILRITSDEADGCSGPNTANGDMTIDSNSSFSVRRERDGFGDGRVYTVVFTETDSIGDVTQSQCKIQVKHDANGSNAIDSGVHACVGTGC